MNAKRAWDSTGNTSRTLICLLGFSGLTMDQPPDTLNITRGNPDDHNKRLKISKKIAISVNSFRKVIDNNHGVKEKNILALLLSIGIESDDLDPAWLATMNTFGEKRGLVAHTSATLYMTVQPPDPATEINTVKQITQELLKIDELINKLMQ